MRMLTVSVVMVSIEVLVVVHWFLLPGNPYLFAMAMTAGVLMCGMALLDFLLMLTVAGKNPSRPQNRRELEDLAQVDPLWAVMTVLGIAFLGAALAAQVYWMATALVIGQGSELAAFLMARTRMRQVEGAGAADLPETR